MKLRLNAFLAGAVAEVVGAFSCDCKFFFTGLTLMILGTLTMYAVSFPRA